MSARAVREIVVIEMMIVIASTPTVAVPLSSLTHQLRQLSDVHRNPSRFVAREQLARLGRAPSVCGEGGRSALSAPATLRRGLWDLQEYVHEGGLQPCHLSRCLMHHLVLSSGQLLYGLPQRG